MKTKKNLKLVVLLFVMTFTVGAAFAATNGMLAFGGTVRINSVVSADEARLEIISVSNAPWDESIVTVESAIVNTGGRQRLRFDAVIHDFERFYYGHIDDPTYFVNFTVENTGNVPVRIIGNFDMDVSDHPLVIASLNNGGRHLLLSSGRVPTYAAELFGIIEPGQTFTGNAGIGSRRWLRPAAYSVGFDGYIFSGYIELPYEQAQ